MRKPHVLEASNKMTYPERVIFFDSESEVPIEITDQEIQRAIRRQVHKEETGDVRKDHKPYLVCSTFWNINDKGKPIEKSRDYLPARHQLETDERFSFLSSFWKQVDRFASERKTTYMFAHNGKYDVMVTRCVPELVSLGYVVTSFSDSNPFIIHFEKSRHYYNREGEKKTVTKRIEILSSTNFFQSSLAKLGETFKLEKLDFDHNREIDLKDPAFWRESLTYAHRDVEILKVAMLSFFEFIKKENLGRFCPTVASQSFMAFRHRFMNTNIYIHDNVEALEVERRAYSGGRNECFRIGKLKGERYVLDINSMYPHVMKEFKYPTKLIYFWKKPSINTMRAAIDAGHLIVADVYVNTDLPMFHKKATRLTFPTGKFWTTLCTPEIIAGLERGLITEVANVCVYEAENIFAEFVDYFYKKRLEAKHAGDSVHDLLYKIIMNSLYGKFGQKAIQWKEVLNPDGTPFEVDPEIVDYDEIYDPEKKTLVITKTFGGRKYTQIKDDTEVESHNSFPAVAAHVTSYARMSLWNFIEAAGLEHVAYCDTDSLFVDSIGYERLLKAGAIDPDRLGALKLEAHIKDLELFGCKDYRYHNLKKGQDIVKMKGVSAKSVFIGNNELGQPMYASTVWMGFTARFKSGNFVEYYNTVRIKTLKREYTKGIIKGDKILPFQLNEERSAEVVTTEEQMMLDLKLPPKPVSDPLLALCLEHGYIQTPNQGEPFYKQYKELPRKKRGMYFRLEGGISVTTWSQKTGVHLMDLYKQLKTAN